VMLMLVVTIIIAAVVSSFAGGTMSGQHKTPQAQISAQFSVSQGLMIEHQGGDPLATDDAVFMVRNGRTFGPNLEQITAQELNKSYIHNGHGKYLLGSDGIILITSFKTGDVFYIDAENSTCDRLQPVVAPQDWESSGSSGSVYLGGDETNWNLCFRNPDSIGKQFSFEVHDRTGKLISRSDVTISP
jgi:hypothetical protein